MTTHFISDLHLTPEQPHLLRLFEYYLSEIAPSADELYILGDLFEVWIGDDYLPQWLKPIENKLAELSKGHSKIFFCHGNRDFLVGNEFSKRTGIQLLDEYATINLGNISALLCHGDSLCTDDIKYIEFRNQVRTKQWQNNFLSLPIEQRLAIVNDYRDQSAKATAEKNVDIMDVKTDTVSQIMQQYQCPILIHGHTHRPNKHESTLFTRMVLSDWYHYGQFLSFDDDTFESIYFNQDNRVKSWEKV